MNLKKVMFWRNAAPEMGPAQNVRPQTQTLVDAEPALPAADRTTAAAAATGGPPLATVIPLVRPGTPAPASSDDSTATAEFTPTPAQPSRMKGLMNEPELEVFFKANRFGFGRHHGSHYRTLEALEHGLEAVVSEFQNIVADMVERRQVKLDKLGLARQQVCSLSAAMAEELDLASRQTEREMAALREQIALASQRKGWVLDALNRYRLGFDRGVREALDFELLNA